MSNLAETEGALARGYGWLAQLFHWVTAVLVFALIGIALYMDGLPLGPEAIKIYNIHKSIGVTVLALTLLRLAWRQIAPPPPLPPGMAGWEVAAARASHFLLYALLLAQPAVGVVHSWSANFPVVIFGLFALPNLTGPNEPLKEALGLAHFVLGWALAGLVLVHIGAALRHHFWLKDTVLARMLPGGGGKP